MAFISVMIGGFGGFISFLAAWLVMDFSFLSSFALYAGFSIGMTILGLAIALITSSLRGAKDNQGIEGFAA